MRAFALAVLAGSATAVAGPAAGSYRDLTRQPPSADREKRTELACAKPFAEANARAKEEPEPAKPPATEDVFTRRKRYEAREAELAAMSRDELFRAATDRELVATVNRRILDADLAGAKLTPIERGLSAAEDLSGEVYNGGFHQYFFNSAGNTTAAARDALRAYGATETLALLECAMTAFPKSTPSAVREKRGRELERWGERQYEVFRDLDRAFYRLPVRSPVPVAFLRKHVRDLPHVERGAK